MNGYLKPRVVQLTGIALLIFFTAFWAATGKDAPELILASTGLIASGQGWELLLRKVDRMERTHAPRHPERDDEEEQQ